MARPSDVTASDPELAAPKFATWWATLTYVVSTMLLGYPALTGQFLLNGRSDQYLAGYAFRDFAAQSLKSGHGFPQWNPFLQGGLPYIAAMHGDIFYPTFLLRMILPTDVAMTWEFIIHMVLAGLFTYLFLRAWNFGFWSALIGGLAYMMGGSIAGYASPGHDGKLFVSALMPLALLLLTRGVRDDRKWAWGALAVTLGLAFLSPHPQLFQYTLIVCGAFTLYLVFSTQPGRRKPTGAEAGKKIALAAGSVVLGIVIGAIQYWPSLIEYKSWSPRASGHDWAAATSYSFPIEETLNSYWPQFSGILDSYWGRNGVHLHSDFFGVVVLLLFGAAFGLSQNKSFKRFWIWTGAVSLIWAFGSNTPFYHLVYAFVPETKYLRAPSTMIFVTAFSVAVLAAFGVERLVARQLSPKYPLIWIGAAGLFGLLMSVGGYSALVSAVASSFVGEPAFPGASASQIIEYVNGHADPNRSAAILGVWRSFLFLAASAGLIWAFLTDRVRIKPAILALSVLLVVDLWSIERLYWQFMPPASKTFASDAAIDGIKADIAKNGPGRVLNVPLNERALATTDGRADRTFSGDALMIHDVRIPTGYHGNELGMYDQLAEQQNVIISPAFWRHENIQYWYSELPDSVMDQAVAQFHLPHMTRIAGPARDAVGTMVYAYKIDADNPFAHVASAMVKAPQQVALATITDQRFEPASVAIVDTSAKDVQGVQLQTMPAPATIHAKVTAYAPGSADISLDAPATAGQALVISENYFPGWHAIVNGNDIPAAIMDYNLVGIPLPAGAKTIQFRFTDRAYEKGKPVTLIALVLAIALWIGGAMIDRRQTPSVAAA